MTLSALACATPRPPALPPSLPLEEAMSRVGRCLARHDAPQEAPHVVVIKDRHSVRPGFHRVRPQLREVQRENRLLVDYLLANGFRLLGCERPLGPLVPDEATAAQYRIIESRLKHGDELDEYGVFQPIRYQLELGPALAVHGVEDEALFRRDLDDFETYLRSRRQARRRDLPLEVRARHLEAAGAARRRLKLNTDARGRACAENLLKLMEREGADRAILLVGGAHVPAATAALRDAGSAVSVFEGASYAAPAPRGSP